MEAEFHKFGKLEDFKFFRDRNTACVEFFNLDDATQAMKIMNGKRIGGEQIRVDFLRSNSTKRVSLFSECWFCFLFFYLLFFSYLLYTAPILMAHCSIYKLIFMRLVGNGSLKMRQSEEICNSIFFH